MPLLERLRRQSVEPEPVAPLIIGPCGALDFAAHAEAHAAHAERVAAEQEAAGATPGVVALLREHAARRRADAVRLRELVSPTLYESCDIPPGLTIAAWRSARNRG